MVEVALGDLITPAAVSRAGDRDLPLLSMTMHQGLVDQSERFKKRIASQDVADYKVVERGQLVVGFPIDEGVLDFQDLYPAGIVSPAYGVWEVADEELVDRDYLRLALRSNRSLTYYRSKLRGSTARRRSLPASTFLALPVPLPPLGEQRRTAAILDRADSIRTKRRALLTELEALKQAVFDEIFGHPATWSARWAVGTIGDLVESTQYGTAEKSGTLGAWPVLRMGNLTDDGRLDFADLKFLDIHTADVAKYTLRPGDILFNRTNSKEKVGKTAVVRTDEPLAFAGYLVRVRLREGNQPDFVSAYLNSPTGRSIRRGIAKAAVNQANINPTEMKQIPIALPPHDVQAAFAHSVVKIEEYRVLLRRALAADDELSASLQSRAFSGGL